MARALSRTDKSAAQADILVGNKRVLCVNEAGMHAVLLQQMPAADELLLSFVSYSIVFVRQRTESRSSSVVIVSASQERAAGGSVRGGLQRMRLAPRTLLAQPAALRGGHTSIIAS